MEPVNRPKHTLVAFMEELYRSMQADYERIRARAVEDPGTAGDEGEERWAELLRNWLPATYPVVTKGRIINTAGETSPQVDVLVLHPAYPQYLRNQKLYLADGVIAAFECKLTLKRKHVRTAVETGVKIKHLYEPGEGTPYRELRRPIIYGLLAHSSEYRGDAADITYKVQDRLEDALEGAIEHPSEMLDLVCVADAGTLSLAHYVAIGPLFQDSEDELLEFDSKGGVLSYYFATSAGRTESRDTRASVLGQFLSDLMRRMAWQDTTLQRLSAYFERAIPAGGIARPIMWPSTVLSEPVIQRITDSGYVHEPWSEWRVMV